MKKLLLLACSIVLYASHSIAQPKIETSDIFEEPLSQGWTQILSMSNGNAFYLHYGGKSGIELFLFDKAKHLAATEKIVSDNWNADNKKTTGIAGCYEINGELVIFLTTYNKFTPVLFRLRIDPSTGKLIQEEEITVQTKSKKFWGFARSYMDQSITVKVDPDSKDYVVVFNKALEKNPNDRLCLVHYSADHKKLTTAYFRKPSRDVTGYSIIDYVVDGSKRVFVASYGASSGKGDDGHVFLSVLKAGDTSFTTRKVEFTEDFQGTRADMMYDRKNERLVMLSNTRIKTKKKLISGDVITSYLSLISFYDPEALSLKGVKPLTSEKINDYAQKTMGKDIKFQGLPQKLEISDGAVTLLSEDISNWQITSSKGNVSAYYATLGNIGITRIANDGTETSGIAILKKQLHVGSVGELYLADRESNAYSFDYGARQFTDDNLYMSFQYVHGKKADYVLFNDDPANEEKSESSTKRKTAQLTDYINTICYTIKDGAATRSFLFGEPENEKKSKACQINGTHYNRQTNVFTTVLSEQHGRNKYDSRIAWISFE